MVDDPCTTWSLKRLCREHLIPEDPIYYNSIRHNFCGIVNQLITPRSSVNRNNFKRLCLVTFRNGVYCNWLSPSWTKNGQIMCFKDTFNDNNNQSKVNKYYRYFTNPVKRRIITRSLIIVRYLVLLLKEFFH